MWYVIVSGTLMQPAYQSYHEAFEAADHYKETMVAVWVKVVHESELDN